jgi:hypothetical protein
MAGITTALSAERLAKYRQPGDKDAMVLARYTWNQTLADSTSLPLHVFEVTLRNTINRAGVNVCGRPSKHGGVPSWLHADPPFLRTNHAETTAASREDLRVRGAPRTPSRLIAELSLGFWVLLFGAYDDQGAGRHGYPGLQLWTPGNLRQALPNVRGTGRDRETLRKHFDGITKYRNRLAHHEPGFHLDPMKRYQEIITAIRWMNADAADYAEFFSRFSDVYTAGPNAFLPECRNF